MSVLLGLDIGTSGARALAVGEERLIQIVGPPALIGFQGPKSSGRGMKSPRTTRGFPTSSYPKTT